MCGRFALTCDPADLRDTFPEFTFPAQFAPRFNIAPTQPILVLPNDGTNKADFFVWGLIPSWAKDPVIGSRLINARAETLVEKPSFRSAYKYRRCLIFADGFYEWQAQPGGFVPPVRHTDGTKPSVQPGSKSRIPHFIRLKSGKPFAFAGLWEHWQSPDGSEVKSATVITTSPNELMAPIHNRMPVVLRSDSYAQWLDSSPQQPSGLQSLLVPYPAAEMEAYPVSLLVNSPGNDRPECIIAAEMQKPGF
jgi:putative SOS response-associated peptidase YedK